MVATLLVGTRGTNCGVHPFLDGKVSHGWSVPVYVVPTWEGYRAAGNWARTKRTNRDYCGEHAGSTTPDSREENCYLQRVDGTPLATEHSGLAGAWLANKAVCSFPCQVVNVILMRIRERTGNVYGLLDCKGRKAMRGTRKW